MADNVTLRSGGTEVDLAALGAEMTGWRVAGRELMWNGDARWWPRRSPILFPVCGWTNGGKLRAKGVERPCDVHSFGRESRFELVQTSSATARMRLVETPDTLAAFPYRFEVTVEVTVQEAAVRFEFTVANPGEEPLPFALGYHPGFVWPFDGGEKEAYRVEFSADESPFSQKIAPGGLFTPELLPIPLDGRRLDVAKGLRRQDALFIRQSASAACDFVAPSGRRIRIETENFPHWVLWSRPDGAYLCIERWTGEGDPVGFAGDITEKPGQTLLEPGGEQRYAFACAFL